MARTMPLSAGAINEQGAAYRKGLVLGFTMAEALLLLVFCLLVAIGSLIVAQRERYEHEMNDLRIESSRFREEADANKVAIESLKDASGLAEVMKRELGTADRDKIDDLWRKLVESQAIVSRLEEQGIGKEELRRAASDLRELKRFRESGVSPQDVRDSASIAKDVQTALGTKAVNPEKLREVLAKGLEASGAPPHRWPPLIRLSEADGFFFEKGSAEVSSDFEGKLRAQIAPKLLQGIKEYGVDIVEVVGHTDDQPIARRSSNLDKALPAIMTSDAPVSSAIAGDNAGLGLARAVSVANLLLKDSELKQYRILPMSSGQLVRPNQTLALTLSGDVKERRRIEIRLRKSE